LAASLAVFMLSVMRQSATLVVGEHLSFGHLQVGATKVFSQSVSGSSVAYTGLKPILPGHLLIAPTRPVARLSDLTNEELLDLFGLARSAQALVKGRNGVTAFNLAVKDGAAAGQPIPHVHVHLVPRQANDLPQNDMVYDMIDRWSPVEGEDNTPPALEIPDDEQRKPRTEDVMAGEASMYATAAGDAAGQLPEETETVQFGKFSLKASQVFFTSKTGLSFATVNLKPLCPGHVLVIPRRVVQYINDLTTEELDDLWLTVRQVQAVVQGCLGASSANLGLQDGRDAGQSVPHVHVHILPRIELASGL